ncbi:hypothetical protein J4Q44_G00189730 [Coregonus suidteri]|uniref:C2H2-type domain-containing protein n=1 Tax=Coregonus suidteri TaxID=861788 RepID=A0AAN8LEA7_9TELE
MASETSSYPVKIVLNKQKSSSQWRDREMAVEEDSQPQPTDAEQRVETEPILIKDEETAEDVWKADPQEELKIPGEEPGSKPRKPPSFEQRYCNEEFITQPNISPEDSLEHYPISNRPEEPGTPRLASTEVFSTEQHRQDEDEDSLDLVMVKDEKEEELDQTTALAGPDQFVMDETDGQLWTSVDPGRDTDPDGHPDFSFHSTEEYSQNISIFPSHSGLPSVPTMTDDVGPSLHSSIWKPHANMFSAASHMKRHIRTMADGTRQQMPEGQSSERLNSNNEGNSLALQPMQHQYRASEATPTDVEQRVETEPILIKDEETAEDVWKTDPQEELRVTGEESGSKPGKPPSFEQQHCDEEFITQPNISPEDSVEHYPISNRPEEPGTPWLVSTEVFSTEQHRQDEDKDSLDLVKVKNEKEEELDQTTALAGPDQFVMDETDGQLSTSVDPGRDTDPDGHPDFSFHATEEYSQNISIFPSHSGLPSVPTMTDDSNNLRPLLQPTDVEQGVKTEPILIKDEETAEDVWKADPQEELRVTGEESGSKPGKPPSFDHGHCDEDFITQPNKSPEDSVEHYPNSDRPEEPGTPRLTSTEVFSTEQHRPAEDKDSLDLVKVKDEKEEELDQTTALAGPDQFVMDETDGQLWTSVDPGRDTDPDGHPDFSFHATEEYSQNISIFPSHDVGPSLHYSIVKPHANMFSAAAHLKRHVRTLADETRQQMPEGESSFYPMASERTSYPVKIVSNKQRSTSQWRDREMAVEGDSQPQPTDVEQRVETEPILIKDEETAEDVWKADPQEELKIPGEESGSKPGKPPSFEQKHCDEDFITQPNLSPEVSVEHYPNSDRPEEPGTPWLASTEVFSTEQHQPAKDEDSLDLVMVKEEELDQTMALAGPDQFVMDETDGQLWTSVDPGRDADPDGHPDFSFHATEEYSQNISIFPSHSGLPSVPTMTDDVGPSLHSSIWKPHANMFSAASHMKRHIRTLADETIQQMPEGQSSERLNSSNDRNSLALQPRQHQYMASEATVRLSECMTGSNMATTSTFSGYSLSRSSFNMVKRMRTQWRSGGTTERRFSCTFCGKSFQRLCQLKPTDVEQRVETEPVLIKDEETAEAVWKTDPQEELRVTGEESGSKPGKPPYFEQRHCDEDFITQPNISPEESVEFYPNSDHPEEPGTPRLASTEVFSTEQHRPAEDSLDLVMVKNEKEEELDQTTALAGPDQFVMDETDGQLWTSVDPGRDTDPDGHPDFSFHATEEYSQNISIFPSHSGLPSVPKMTDDVGPSLHSSLWKPHANMFSVAKHMTRHVRTLADETRQQMPEGESSERLNSNNEGNSLALHPRQHQYGASESTVRLSECMTGSNMATTSTFSGYSLSRNSFNMVKRMRTQWRSGGDTTERRFSCTFCGKSFQRFSELKVHLRSHTGEKPYTCEQCGRSFTKTCNLIRHAVVHSGEKPYECTQCGKCFTQRSNMTSHQRTHIGESPVSQYVAPTYPGDPHKS